MTAEFQTPKGITTSLITYSVTKDLWLNGLLHKPRGKPRRNRNLGVIALHGSEGSAVSGINAWLAPYLASKGYTVLSPNKRNSGRLFYTSTFELCEDDIRKALRFLEKAEGLNKVALIGHSLGAAEATYYVGKTHDRRVTALVLMGAPLWPRGVVAPKKLRLALKHAKDEYYFLKGWMGMPVSAKHYVSYWGEGSNNNIRRWIGKVRVPILNVAHGIPLNELCNEYSSRQISELAAASPEVKTITVDGAPHSFAGHLMETSSIVTNYLRSKLD